MAERMAAEIRIGGRIKKSVAESLRQVICDAGISLEWGGAQFNPGSLEELLAGLDDSDGVPTLRLCDEEATWGQFESLESFLRQHCILYTRRSDHKYEFDGELVEFRPGHELSCVRTDAAGNPIVGIDEVLAAVELLGDARQALTKGKNPSRTLSRAQRLLERVLPPKLPPLDPFEIDGVKLSKTDAPSSGTRKQGGTRKPGG